MAVVSDCHAKAGPVSGTSDATWVITDRDSPTENPLEGLADFIRDESLTADVLLCPGDLCDKSDWAALPYAWDKLHEIAEALEADTIIATAGNHDIDSRGINGAPNVEDGLTELRPTFPVPLADVRPFWEERICVVRDDHWQVIVLNSTVMRLLTTGEKDHGLISDPTLARLKQVLCDSARPVNVLLCHHHPMPSTHLSPDDRSQMEGGDRLVKLLDEMSDKWFVVHGHKHEPNLDQLGGSANAAIRLASGSIGANLWPRLAAHVRNQFHVVEFPLDQLGAAYVKLGGRVYSYTWQPSNGWRAAVKDEGLPARAGFGHWQDGESIARQTFDWARSEGLEVLDRDALLDHSPQLDFMLPSDQLRWAKQLEDLGCYVNFDLRGALREVVMP